jgi:hypothetical protein
LSSGGLFRQAADGTNATAAAPAPVLNGVLTTLEDVARNGTGMLANALNGTVLNATAALDAARPVLALGGARDTPILDTLELSVNGFGDVVQRVGETVREAGAAARANLNAAVPTVRAASANTTAAANATSNATATNATAAANSTAAASSQSGDRRRQRSRRSMRLL